MPRKVFFSFHYDDVTRANVVRNSDQITRRYRKGARFYDMSLWEEAKKQGFRAVTRMIDEGLHGSSVTCVLIGQHTWQRPYVRYEILKSVARGNGILGVRIQDVGFSPHDRPDSHAGMFGRQLGANAFSPPFSRHRQVLGNQQGLASEQPARTLGSSPDALLAEVLASEPAQRPFLGNLAEVLASGPAQRPVLGNSPWLAVERSAPMLNAFLGGLFGGEPGLECIPAPGPNPLRYLGYTIDWHGGTVRFHEKGRDDRWREYPRVQAMPLRSLPWMSRLPDAGILEDLFSVYDWKQDRGSRYFPAWIEMAASQAGR